MRTIFVVLLLAFPCLADEPLQFNRDIRPILSNACFRCHGLDAKKREADLRLDERSGAVEKRGDLPAAIVAGDPDNSLLIQRILSTDPEQIMPPPSAKRQLSESEKGILKRWISEGASYQKHWAFEPIANPQVPPAVPPAASPANAESSQSPDGSQVSEIDQFLRGPIQKAGLAIQPVADRSTLIRRVAFTLTGLPPTPQELLAFETDRSDNAYEKMVDRYLASNHFGEEMARHWLDVARYGDTHGLHLDNDRQIWGYRDWVVAAFNQNQPFSQFTIDQLAGDLLPNPTKSQLIATGFNRCNVTTSEGGAIDEEFLFRYAVDRTSTTVQSWLGLTGGCAVCHDHKYDPLTTKEFYSLYSFFYSAADPAMDGNIENTSPYLPFASSEQESLLARLRNEAEGLRQEVLKAAEQPSQDAVESASQTGVAQAEAVVDVWIDDEFPIASNVRNTSRNGSKWSSIEASPLAPSIQPAMGRRSLYQSFGDKFEQFVSGGLVPRTIPQQAKVQVWVKLDRYEPPQAIFVELKADKIKRWIWANPDFDCKKIDSSPEQVVGPLPAADRWVQLTLDLTEAKFAEGADVQEIKLGLFGGVCWWDGLQCVGSARAANDLRIGNPGNTGNTVDLRAAAARWWESRKGKDTPTSEGEVAQALKEGPESEVGKRNADKVQAFYTAFIAANPPSHVDQARQRAVAARIDLAILEGTVPGTFIFKDRPEPRQAFVMTRGQYDAKGEPVSPATPAFLPPISSDAGTRLNRLHLARWLVSSENPLTARVTVNRFWQQVFGVGLVKTSDDFGTQGAPPSHPELLDRLAYRFREEGWNVKQLMKELLMTHAFKQASVVTPEGLERDPENRLLARGPRIRLEAEQIRDNVLAISGLLNPAPGGPGAKVYQPPNIWEPVGYGDSNTRYYLQDHGASLYRRSLYCYIKRTAPPPFMSNFDAPNRELFCTRRERSNTPLQALQLMNDVQHFEAARKLAERIIREGGVTSDQRIAFAYRLVLARYPDTKEAEIAKRALVSFLARYRENPVDAKRVLTVGESPADETLNPSELAGYAVFANLLFNLDETVNRN